MREARHATAISSLARRPALRQPRAGAGARTADEPKSPAAATPCRCAPAADQAGRHACSSSTTSACGSAAIATLLTHQYGRPTTEREVFEHIVRPWRPGQDPPRGLLAARHEALPAGARLRDRRLPPAVGQAPRGRPARHRAHHPRHSYHFVVVKDLDRDRVLIGDPAKRHAPCRAPPSRRSGSRSCSSCVHNRMDLALQPGGRLARAAPSAPLASGRSATSSRMACRATARGNSDDPPSACAPRPLHRPLSSALPSAPGPTPVPAPARATPPG